MITDYNRRWEKGKCLCEHFDLQMNSMKHYIHLQFNEPIADWQFCNVCVTICAPQL